MKALFCFHLYTDQYFFYFVFFFLFFFPFFPKDSKALAWNFQQYHMETEELPIWRTTQFA